MTLVLCITGAAAVACSKDKPAQSAYDTERPADQQSLTPASSDHTGHSEMGQTDTDAAGPGGSSMGTGSTSVDADPSSAPDTIPPSGTSRANDGDSTRSSSSSSSSANKGAASGTGSASTAPDNTARNERDRKDSAVTPIDQGNSQADLDITQRIRQAVMKDDSLSFTAKNVKIVTRGGKVTLRGTVQSYEERLAIENAARNVAGQANVTSELEVKK